MGLDRANTLGLDIGGTRLKSVVLSTSGEVVDSFEVDSGASISPEKVREAIKLSMEHFKSKQIPFSAVGVGCAGSVDHSRGVVRNSPNFAHWTDVPVGEWVAQIQGHPAKVDNDANCATLTEWKLGAAKGLNHAILLTLGTGVGGGVIADGRLYRGATGTAGELGHFSINVQGIPCPCGHRGCFERYCSASALHALFPDVSAKEVFASANISPYKEAVENFIENLISAIASLGNIFDPQMVVLGGAVSRGVLPFLPEIEKGVQEKVFPAIAKNLRISGAQFDNWSGAMGAALLAQE